MSAVKLVSLRRRSWRDTMFYIFRKIVQKGLFYYDNEASIAHCLKENCRF